MLPVLTAAAYLGSYFFEIAFLSAYKIPMQLAHIRIENFIFLFVASSMVLMPFFMLYIDYQSDEVNLKNWYRKPVYIAFSVAILILLLVLVPQVLVALIIVAAIILLLRRFAPKLLKKKHNSHPLTSTQAMIAIAILFTMGIIFLSYLSGRFWATNQHEFPVYELPEGRYVLLQNYGDKYILGKLKETELNNGFMVVDTEFLSGKPFVRERLYIPKPEFTSWLDPLF